MHLRTIDMDHRTEIDDSDFNRNRRYVSPARARGDDPDAGVSVSVSVCASTDLVDLAAVRADDELLEAIAAGGADVPTNPIDATLIQLLSLLAQRQTAPAPAATRTRARSRPPRRQG